MPQPTPNTPAGGSDGLAARSEFYLCMARAFMAPLQERLFRAMRDALAADLGELGAQLGYAIDAPLARYREQIGRVADQPALLRIYSALFVAPPSAAHINVGRYLDGAIDGGSVKAMEQAYRRCGVERDARFRDLADHVSVQLEFVAFLYAAAARRCAGEGSCEPMPVAPGEFLQTFAMRWLGGLCSDLARADTERELEANPYAPLALILNAAAARDAVAVAVDAKAARKQRAIERARSNYFGRAVTDADIAQIARKLKQHGLSTDHLSVPVELRDAAMGLEKKASPGPC
jgi:putative dimethyl sulfoxide reductase chaperone